MKVNVKNAPRLRLSDLLRRRKMTMQQVMAEFGLSTYEGLISRCERMGVQAPTIDEFNVATASTAVPNVSSPQEGVVVLGPTDTSINPADSEDVVADPTVPLDEPKKKHRKKKEATAGDEG